jgi:fucose 4-O-acetylase-like acetyltransferase
MPVRRSDRRWPRDDGGMSPAGPSGSRAASTRPPTRELHADLIRVVAIWAVVVGHWLVIAVTEANGVIDGVNALGTLSWAHPLTWLFQVMPLFFFVGGYANAASMARQQRAGGDMLAWVVRRYRRLLLPSTVLLAVVVGAVVVARAVGVDSDTAGTGAWLATVPLWFLAAYLAIVAVAPVTQVAHRRWGLAVPVGLALLVGLVDVARFALDDPWFVNANYLLAWLAIHQLGYSWYDHRLPTTPRVAVPLAAAGLVALIGSTVFGPYPISMVATPGDTLQNTEPPTLALLALAVTQIGVVLGLRDHSTRWLRKERRARLVARIESVVFTLFLWHMAAAVVAAALLYGTGIVAVVPLDSRDWLLWRIPWVAACAVLLAGLVTVFGRVERAARRSVRGARTGRPVMAIAVAVGIVLTLGGILSIALAGSGSHGPLALPTDALLAFGLGNALLATAHSRTSRRPL